MNRIRVGVIGAGMRSASYFRNMPPEFLPYVEITTIADPNEDHRTRFVESFASNTTVRHYDQGADLLREEDLDALIIGSPNHTHAEAAILAMPRRIPILLEKPVAISLKECQSLWQAYLEAGKPPVTVGFVLRYAPFYEKAKELIASGAVGQVLTMDADEMLGTGLSAVFYRGWRGSDNLTGGFMVEKCCHDFDILRWLTAANAEQVFSLARRSHLMSNPQGARHQRFEAGRSQSAAMDYGDAHTQAMFTALSDESLYEAKSDVPDHQSVMIGFDNGVLSSFTACLAQPRTDRRLRVYGANGAFRGDASGMHIDLEMPGDDPASVDRRDVTFPVAEGGHHGADPSISKTFWNTVISEPATIKAGIREGIEAVLIGLAAEASKKSGSSVNLLSWRRQVFGDDNSGGTYVGVDTSSEFLDDNVGRSSAGM